MEHRVIQYDLDGQFVRVWDNANKAAEAGMDSQATIRKSLKGVEMKKLPNFQWRFFSEGYPQEIAPYENNSRRCNKKKERQDDAIEELAWDGTVIATYNGTSEAAEKSGCSQSYVCNVLAGKIKHPKHRFRRVG